jgi:thiopurine S-methyltransferase
VLEDRVPSEEPLDKKDFAENLFLLTPLEEDRVDVLDYWQGRWVSGTSSIWHSDAPNPYLVKYWDLLKMDKDPKELVIFIPLCGKAGELVWLYRQGLRVVGVEGVPYVAEAVFRDNGIQFARTALPEVNGFVLEVMDDRCLSRMVS